MVNFEWDPDHVPIAKLALHGAQILFAFTLWCMEIAVFNAKGASVVGDNGWTFAVCFLSIPAWVYLIMTPRFERTRKFALPVAMLAVDGVFVVIWLSAFATQASYNSKNLCGEKCGVSKAIVALGVFVTLLFAASTFVSAYTMTYYNFHNTLPGYDNRKIRSGSNDIDPDKEAFSMAPHGDEAYDRVHMEDHEHEDASHAPYNGGRYDADDPSRYGALPRRESPPLFDSNTEYNSGQQTHYTPPPAQPLSSNPATATYNNGPAQFPAGNYDRVDR